MSKALSILLIILIFIAFGQFLEDKYYPFTYIGDTNISFLTEGQATKTLQTVFDSRAQQKLPFGFSQGTFEIDLATSSASLDYSNLTSAYLHQRLFPFWQHFKKEVLNPKITLVLDNQFANIAASVNRAPQNARLTFEESPSFDESEGSAKIQIIPAEDGLSLNKEKLQGAVEDFLLTGKYEPQLPLTEVPPKVSTSHILRAKEILERSVANPLKLTFNSQNWTIDTKQLLLLLDLTKGERLLDYEQTQSYLKKIAAQTDQEVAEGLFEFNPATKRVTAFRPSQEGRKLNIQKTYQVIVDSLENDGEKNIVLPIDIIKPKIETSDVNSLGIKELLGRGISNFAGSIENRIYNVNLTAYKINGILIPPNQTFSFNQTVGDITEATGFKKAYVIKEGRTILDDGGGVCQVSTTLFRAVLNAGLPVIKRTAHAYRVGYYEQGFPPGLDATVFYPSVDFQFKNDTPAHILIQAYTAGNSLYVDLYGTSDGRTVNITKPIVTDQTPPPPDLRQDDPTLPRGTVKQVDWSAWGANVSFKRTVIRNGQTLINETWKSVFKPWQAVFLVGTKEN